MNFSKKWKQKVKDQYINGIKPTDSALHLNQNEKWTHHVSLSGWEALAAGHHLEKLQATLYGPAQ